MEYKKKSPTYKIRITDQIKELASSHLRLTKSGDIKKNLNNYNNKLLKNIQELGQITQD